MYAPPSCKAGVSWYFRLTSPELNVALPPLYFGALIAPPADTEPRLPKCVFEYSRPTVAGPSAYEPPTTKICCDDADAYLISL